MKKYLFKLSGANEIKVQVNGKNTKTAISRLLNTLDDYELYLLEEIKIYELDC